MVGGTEEGRGHTDRVEASRPKDLGFGIFGTGSLSALGRVGWKGTTGAEGFDVESSVLSVLGCKIRAQSNLLVRLGDFLRTRVRGKARPRERSDGITFSCVLRLGVKVGFWVRDQNGGERASDG